MEPTHTHRIRVRYCETDRMGLAHHGSYVAWLEEARTEWMRVCGRTYRQMEDDGELLVVVDMQQFFLDPASPTFTCGGQAILPGVQRLVAAFRRAGRPVLFTRHVHHPDGLDDGIMGWWWKGIGCCAFR